jgi:hypothetical protein
MAGREARTMPVMATAAIENETGGREARTRVFIASKRQNMSAEM